jgi:hypothetical protein
MASTILQMIQFLQVKHVEQHAAQMGQSLHARHRAGAEALQHLLVEPVNEN